MPRPVFRPMSFALAAALALAGCTSEPLREPLQSLADRDISKRTPDSTLSRQDALNFFREKPVTVMQTDASQQFQLNTDIGGQVPRVSVERLNAAPMRFPEILAQIGEQVGMSWSITGDGREDLLSREVYYVQRNETMLETVLEELSKSTNSFYRIDGDRIVFEQTRSFTTSIPRFAGSQDIIRAGIESLGATNVFVDSITGAMTFRADRRAYHAILDLMRSFQAGRDMIVYDFWIIDRTLRDSAGAGVEVSISRDDVESTIGNAGALDTLDTGGDGISFQGNLGNLDVETTMRFVRALGQAETVARPTISMLSGSSADFESGERYEYIRSIEASTTDDDVASSTDVRELNTGVNINVAGAHNAGVISSDLEIELRDLIEFRNFETGEITLQLPRTSERNINTQIEARPGDVMIIGGIIRDRQDKTQRNVAATSIPTSRTAQSIKTETIILVRPRLVQIRPSGRTTVAVPQKYDNVVGNVLADEKRARALLDGMVK